MDHVGKPFALNAEQVVRLNDLFQKIVDELSSTYRYKPELLAILLMQLAHFLIRNLLHQNVFEPKREDRQTNTCWTICSSNVF